MEIYFPIIILMIPIGQVFSFRSSAGELFINWPMLIYW